MFLVTGCKGQLGNELRLLLGSKAVYIDKEELDITDESAVRAFFENQSFDMVINCVAYTAVDKAEDDFALADKINRLGSAYLAKYGRHIIEISTDYVFDGTGHRPYLEDDVPNPVSVYGSTKLEGERAALQFAETAIIIRTAWLYSSFGNNFVKTMQRLGKERVSLGVVCDQIGTPTYAADLASAIVAMLPKIQPGQKEIYHYTNEGVASWYDFAHAIMEYSGINCEVNPLQTEEYPTKAKRPAYSVLCKAKIRDRFNLAIPHWTDGLKRCAAKLCGLEDLSSESASPQDTIPNNSLPFFDSTSIMTISKEKSFSLLKYYRYKILSKITFGRRRKYYKNKYKIYKIWKHCLKNSSLSFSEAIKNTLYQDYVNSLFNNSHSQFVELADSDIDAAAIPCKLIAFYLPQYHAIPLNDRYHGKGFTEWDNVAQAKPLYIGHNQPQLPIDVGFYDLSHPDVMYRQVELAKKYGISAFCFHYYWFSGTKLLDAPINNFFNHKDLNFQFCICWANENWSLKWDGGNKEIIQEQKLNILDGIKFVDDIIQFVKDPRYIKVNDMPLLIIYRPTLFNQEIFLRLIGEIRTRFDYYGVKQVKILTTTAYLMDTDRVDITVLNLDGILEFPPHGLRKTLAPINNEITFITNCRKTIFDMKKAIEEKFYFSTKYDDSLYRGIFPSWDNTARKVFTGGYIYDKESPQLYKQWLKDIINWTSKHHKENDRIIFINAWNEWGEGAHLEPDKKYGYAYLQATREALEEIASEE